MDIGPIFGDFGGGGELWTLGKANVCLAISTGWAPGFGGPGLWSRPIFGDFKGGARG